MHHPSTLPSDRANRPGKLHWTLAAVAFVAALILLHERMYVPSEWGDEGYFANGALRVLSGQVIYRDFQHNYPPGRIYGLALLLEIFGRDLAVVRTLWITAHAGAVAAGLLVASRMMTLPFAALVSVAILFNSVHQNKAIELLLASIVLLVLFRVLERRTSDLAAGAWLALVAHFRQDVAVFGAVLFAGTLAMQVLQGDGDGTLFVSRLLRRVRQAWPFPAAFALAGAPFTLYLLFEGALLTGLRELAFSGFVANRALSKPFPPLIPHWSPSGLGRGLLSDGVVYYIPLLVYALCLVIGSLRLRRPCGRLVGAYVVVTCGLGLMLFLQVIPITDPGHLNKAYLPAHVLGLFLVFLTVKAAWRSVRHGALGPASLFLLLAVPAVALPLRHFRFNAGSAASLWKVIDARRVGGRSSYETVEFPHGRLRARGWRADELRRMTRNIPPCDDAGPTESMVVYPAGAIFNFLFGCPSPLRYDVLRPGETGLNDPRVLSGIIGKVERTRPRVLMETRLEASNPEVRALLTRYARDEQNGYRKLEARRFTAYVRE